MTTKTRIFLSVFLLNPLISLHAANELDSLSLEELMDIKVTSATDSEKSLREAPGSITVLTDKEIKDIGARDLKDILLTVPGITFGYDVLGNISIIMRGIWAQEGRILLNIDGVEMNERSYGTILLSNHYAADHIKRIEIIRGPGSAIYGGFAELGVINITTKIGKDLKGAAVSTSYSRTSKDLGQFNNNFMFGQQVGDLDFSAKGTFTDSNFSDRNYTDQYGTTANLGKGNSRAGGDFLNIRGSYKGFFASHIRDAYKTENIILWGDLDNNNGAGPLRKPVPKQYLTDAYQVGFQKQVTEKIEVYFQYLLKNQRPYFQSNTKDEVALGNSWRRSVERKVYRGKLNAKLSNKLNVNVGMEQSEDKSYTLNRLTHSGSTDVFGHNQSNVAAIQNLAVFGQFDYASDLVNLTGGMRYDKPSVFNDVFVPRLGLTKVLGKTHFKVLYAEAFRAPVIENLSLNKNIRPERTTTSEVEVGYQLSQESTWIMNIYKTKVNDAIIYSYDSIAGTEHYNNYKHVKTLGLENELRFNRGIHNFKLNHSVYKVDSLKATPYKTGKDSSALLGASKHKLYFHDALSLTEKFTLTPSLTYLKDTYTRAWNGAAFAETRLDNQFLASLYGNYKNLFIPGLELGLGINNLLNSKIYYAQPYLKDGDYPTGPYPGISREYIVKVGYSNEF